MSKPERQVRWQVDKAAHDPKAKVVATIEGFAIFRTEGEHYWAIKGEYINDAFVVSEGFEIPWRFRDKLALDKQKLLTEKVSGILRKRQLQEERDKKTKSRSKLIGDE